MASRRIIAVPILCALALAFAPAPAAAQSTQAPSPGTVSETGPVAPQPPAPVGTGFKRQAEVDSEVAQIMQMLRDEGIDIDDRMARARVLCRNRVMSEAADATEARIAEKIEECTLVEEGVIYARAINEMNANRAAAFDSAMEEYNAEVAEVERKKSQYERDMERHNAEVAEVKRKQEQFALEQQQYEAEMAAHEKMLAERGLPVPERRAGAAAPAQAMAAQDPPARIAQQAPNPQSAQAGPAPQKVTLAQASGPSEPKGPVETANPAPRTGEASGQASGQASAQASAAPSSTVPATVPATVPSLARNNAPSGPPPQAGPPRNEPTQRPQTQTPQTQTPQTRPAESAPAPTRGVGGPRGYGKRLSDASDRSAQEQIELAVAKASGPRIALVIGNEEYSSAMGSLANPVNDAVLIGQTLRILGFDVEIVRDANQKQMKEAVQRLGQRLAEAGDNATGLFYYAGHGVQSKGLNYLIPVESAIDAESDLELEAVPADAILAQMEEAYISTRIVILDACRNMPLRRRTRSGTRGLARMETPNGSFVAYSTSPGSIAADGGGTNSPFAESLAEQMLVPDRSIEETFREVRRQVVENTSGDQVPWNSSSLLDKFSFAIGG